MKTVRLPLPFNRCFFFQCVRWEHTVMVVKSCANVLVGKRVTLSLANVTVVRAEKDLTVKTVRMPYNNEFFFLGIDKFPPVAYLDRCYCKKKLISAYNLKFKMPK